jgi:hypothetical protein
MNTKDCESIHFTDVEITTSCSQSQYIGLLLALRLIHCGVSYSA